MGSIYDDIGGAEALAATVDEFYVRVSADPLLAPYFADSNIDRVKAHQRSFIAATSVLRSEATSPRSSAAAPSTGVRAGDGSLPLPLRCGALCAAG